MIRGIHHIAMHTANFDRMVEFYRDAFGFTPLTDEFGWRDSPVMDRAIDVDRSAARGLMLKAGNCYLEMFEYFSPPPREAGAARPNDRGYTHFCVDVTDIEAECERLAELGMSFPIPEPVDGGDVKFVYGKDPDGNVIEIIELAEDHIHALEQLEQLDMTSAAGAAKA